MKDSTTSSQDLINHFSHYSDQIIDLNKALIVKRPNNKNVVMVPQSEFNAWIKSEQVSNND